MNRVETSSEGKNIQAKDERNFCLIFQTVSILSTHHNHHITFNGSIFNSLYCNKTNLRQKSSSLSQKKI